MWDFIKIYVPIGLLIAAGFLFTWQFVDPAPPKALVIATGSPGGAYTGYAERYKKVLAEAGLKVTIRHTAGAGENLGLLNDPKSGVDVAFVQGGIGDPFGAPELVSLGSVFLEPLWLFVREASNVKRINDLN